LMGEQDVIDEPPTDWDSAAAVAAKNAEL